MGSEDATFIVNSTDDDGWIGIGFSMVYLMYIIMDMISSKIQYDC